MENTNEMKIIFDSRPENEGLARVAAAAQSPEPYP